MQLRRIELIHLSIPCLQPFETSFGVISERPALIIRMESDDGTFGLGESSPLDVPISEAEITATALPLLRQILPTLIGAPVDADHDIRALYPDVHAPVSLIGIEGAYLDLVARAKGIPMNKYFSATNTTVALGESVSLYDTIEDTLAAVDRYLSEGITRIKIKIAPGRDVEVLQAVRAAHPSLVLGADANASYTASDVAHLAQLASLNLEFIEQPFHEDDLSSHRALRSHGIPIALDESVRDLATAHAAFDVEACDFINIKPARIGSFAEAKQIHDFALEKEIRLFGGGRLETGIGKTMNAHFYALPGFTDASDITAPSKYLAVDIITPSFITTNATYQCGSGSGLGITLDTERMTPYVRAHEKYEVT